MYTFLTCSQRLLNRWLTSFPFSILWQLLKSWFKRILRDVLQQAVFLVLDSRTAHLPLFQENLLYWSLRKRSPTHVLLYRTLCTTPTVLSTCPSMHEISSIINNRRRSSALAPFYEITSTSQYSTVSALVLLYGNPLIEGDHQDMPFFMGSTVFVNNPSDKYCCTCLSLCPQHKSLLQGHQHLSFFMGPQH
jgi:hypothetical protein